MEQVQQLGEESAGTRGRPRKFEAGVELKAITIKVPVADFEVLQKFYGVPANAPSVRVLDRALEHSLEVANGNSTLSDEIATVRCSIDRSFVELRDLRKKLQEDATEVAVSRVEVTSYVNQIAGLVETLQNVQSEIVTAQHEVLMQKEDMTKIAEKFGAILIDFTARFSAK